MGHVMMTVPVVIDIEASGHGQHSYPIEIGFSRRHGEGWCSLVRPEPVWLHWDKSAEQKHRIPRELLVERGKTSFQIAQEMNDMLSGLTIYSDGWSQDSAWLTRLFKAAGLNQEFRLADLREIIMPAQVQAWNATRLQVEDDLNISRRRASNDARILQLTWLRTYDAMCAGLLRH